MGQFRTGRALDEGQWIARDNTFFTVVKTFTEQAALYKAELSCYEKIHSIDEVMCDGKSFLLSRILEEAFPEPNEEEAQLVLEADPPQVQLGLRLVEHGTEDGPQSSVADREIRGRAPQSL